jgi:hypothetical protein
MTSNPSTIVAALDPHNSARWGEAEQMRRLYRHLVPISVSPAQLLEPSYWAPLHKFIAAEPRFAVGSMIEAVAEDGSFYALLMIVGGGDPQGVPVAELGGRILGGLAPAGAAPQGNGERVEWRGLADRWCVVDATGEVIRTGFDTQSAAGGAMYDHRRDVADAKAREHP